MTKTKGVSMTNVITVRRATKEFPKLVKDVKGSKRRYVLSLKGKPEAVVLGFDDYLRSILRSKRSRTVTRIQEEAMARGLNKLTLKDIDAEIAAYRKSKK